VTAQFIDVITAPGADSDTIQQALRYYLARRLDDMTPDEMLAELQQVVGGPRQVDAMVQQLSADPLLLENAGLLVLSGAWEDSQERPVVEEVIDDAKGKMPVIEVAILAIVALYGLYLWRTGGVARSEKTAERKADGTVIEREIVEYASVDSPLTAITKLLPTA